MSDMIKQENMSRYQQSRNLKFEGNWGRFHHMIFEYPFNAPW